MPSVPGCSSGAPLSARRARRDIEVFFKQVKRALKPGDFLGHEANAIRRQVWTALLVHVLPRFAAHISQ